VDTTGAYGQIFGGGQVSINNRGEIVFGASLKAGGRGLFNGPDPVADKIIAIGDELLGSGVVGLPQNFMNPRGLNNAGQILFSANLADGRTVIVRADPDGEGHQGEDASMAPSVLAAALIGLSPPAAAMSSTLAFPPSSLQGDGRGMVPGGGAPTPLAMPFGDVGRLDQLFAAGMEDGTSWFLSKVRRDPLSCADDLGVDVVSWE